MGTRSSDLVSAPCKTDVTWGNELNASLSFPIRTTTWLYPNREQHMFATSTLPAEILGKKLPKEPHLQTKGVALKTLQGHFMADILVFYEESALTFAMR